MTSRRQFLQAASTVLVAGAVSTLPSIITGTPVKLPPAPTPDGSTEEMNVTFHFEWNDLLLPPFARRHKNWDSVPGWLSTEQSVRQAWERWLYWPPDTITRSELILGSKENPDIVQLKFGLDAKGWGWNDYNRWDIWKHFAPKHGIVPRIPEIKVPFDPKNPEPYFASVYRPPTGEVHYDLRPVKQLFRLYVQNNYTNKTLWRILCEVQPLGIHVNRSRYTCGGISLNANATVIAIQAWREWALLAYPDSIRYFSEPELHN